MPTEDNFNDIGLLFHIINPQILAYTRKKKFCTTLWDCGITFQSYMRLLYIFYKFTHCSQTTGTSQPCLSGQCTVPSPVHSNCSRKQADSMLFFPTLVFFRGVQAGVIFTRFAKRKQISFFPSEKGKNPLFTSDK